MVLNLDEQFKDNILKHILQEQGEGEVCGYCANAATDSCKNCYFYTGRLSDNVNFTYFKPQRS
ncbi:MAG: hypothetical protein ACTSRA_00025 [Promethearchaeota archaeon]|nr:MAG: hypothetical protein [Helarchaeota virus Nidhogg Meg22_1012]